MKGERWRGSELGQEAKALHKTDETKQSPLYL